MQLSCCPCGRVAKWLLTGRCNKPVPVLRVSRTAPDTSCRCALRWKNSQYLGARPAVQSLKAHGPVAQYERPARCRVTESNCVVLCGMLKCLGAQLVRYYARSSLRMAIIAPETHWFVAVCYRCQPMECLRWMNSLLAPPLLFLICRACDELQLVAIYLVQCFRFTRWRIVVDIDGDV